MPGRVSKALEECSVYILHYNQMDRGKQQLIQSYSEKICLVADRLRVCSKDEMGLK